MKKLGLLLSAIIAAAISSAAQTPADTTAVMEAITQPIHPNGYMGEASIEVLATGAYHSADIGITTTHGVMFKDRYFFGGGAGYLRDFNANQYLIPIYIDGRIFFKSAGNKRIYPHVGLRLGGALVSEGSSGFYGALSGGVRVPIGRHLGLSIDIGPHLITKYERPSYGKEFHANGYKIGFFGRSQWISEINRKSRRKAPPTRIPAAFSIPMNVFFRNFAAEFSITDIPQ